MFIVDILDIFFSLIATCCKTMRLCPCRVCSRIATCFIEALSPYSAEKRKITKMLKKMFWVRLQRIVQKW